MQKTLVLVCVPNRVDWVVWALSEREQKTAYQSCFVTHTFAMFAWHEILLLYGKCVGNQIWNGSHFTLGIYTMCTGMDATRGLLEGVDLSCLQSKLRGGGSNSGTEY